MSTIPLMALRMTYARGEEDAADRAQDELLEEIEKLHLETIETFTTGDEDGSHYTTLILVKIPKVQKLIEKVPELVTLQSRYHAIFLAASRPSSNNPSNMR